MFQKDCLGSGLSRSLKRPTRRQSLSSVAFAILASSAAPVMARSISAV
jgi:hypothetical protein